MNATLHDFITQFHFIRPEWLWLALPSLCLVVFLIKKRSQQSGWSQVISPELLPFLSKASKSSNRAKGFDVFLNQQSILSALFILGVLALAGPTWTKKTVPLSKNKSAAVILLDLSPSMLAQDLKPSRLVRARHKLNDLLKARGDGLTALIAYSGDAHVVTPLTDDVETITSLLNTLSPNIMPARGSNIEEAYTLALDLLAESKSRDGQIIVLTDGIALSAETALIELTQKSKFKTAIWSIGTPAGAPIPLGDGQFARKTNGEILISRLDENALSNTAVKLRATYVPYSADDLDVNTITHFVTGSQQGDSSETQMDDAHQKQFDDWEEYGRYLALPVALLFALLFRRGWALPLAFMFTLGSISFPHTAQANPLDKLLKTNDQRAEQALQAGDYQKAGELFENADWRAVAKYKSGEYAAAAQHYKNGSTASDAFNLGNAHVQQQQYEHAIEAYNQALKRSPGHQGALRNKEIAEQLLALRQNEQNEQNSDENSQGNSGEGPESQKQVENDAQNKSESDQDNSPSDNQNNEQNSNQQTNESGPEQGNQQAGQDQSSQQNHQQRNSQSTPSDQNSNDQQEQAAQNDSGDDITEEQQKALDDHYQSEQSTASNNNHEKTNSAELSQDDASNNDHTSQNSEHADEASTKESTEATAPVAFEQHERMSEDEQALEQWLRRVPDDPGRLMKNKFAQQYREKQRLGNSRSWKKLPNEEQRW